MMLMMNCVKQESVLLPQQGDRRGWLKSSQKGDGLHAG